MTSARRRWGMAGLGFAVLATLLNGIVVGYGSVWFQLFGDRADAGDYRVSAGGYGAAAAVLALAVVAVLDARGPSWLVWTAGFGAGLLAALALSSVAEISGAEPGSGLDGPLDGVGGVLWAPWTWVLVVLGVRGVVRLSARVRA